MPRQPTSTDSTPLTPYGLDELEEALKLEVNRLASRRVNIRALAAIKQLRAELDEARADNEPVAWQRLHPGLDEWLFVQPGDLEFYRGQGQAIRPLYVKPSVPTADEAARAVAQMSANINAFLRRKYMVKQGLFDDRYSIDVDYLAEDLALFLSSPTGGSDGE